MLQARQDGGMLLLSTGQLANSLQPVQFIVSKGSCFKHNCYETLWYKYNYLRLKIFVKLK